MLSVFVLGLVICLTACSSKNSEPLRLVGSTMGTTYHITVADPIKLSRDQIQADIDRRLLDLSQQMSTYISDSELSVFNNAPVDSWQVISDDFFNVLLTSLELGWLSNGAFDITVGPLVNLWGFGKDQHDDGLPDAKQIQALLAQVGFQHLQLDISTSSVMKQQPVAIDLSAVAKGYAVDQIAELLSTSGSANYMVEIGGEIRVKGHNPHGKMWRIAIEEPDGRLNGIHQAINITDKAIATSGDYRNYFEVDGVRYSHTISPKTGYPITHNLASVTVISDESAFADGLATAINVMGAQAGLKLANEHKFAVYLIVKTADGFESLYSQAFIPYLE